MAILDIIRQPLRRKEAMAVQRAVRTTASYANVARVAMVDGKMRKIAELRSIYDSNAPRFAFDVPGILSGDYSKEETAHAYKTGVTVFIGVNVRAGFSSEVPPRCVDSSGEPIIDSAAQCFIDNAPKLIWMLVAHYLVFGVIYIKKIRNRNGYPSDIEVLSPLDVSVEMDYQRGTVLRYRVMRAGAGMEYVYPSDMITDVTWNPFSDVDGTSAVEVAKVRSDIETNIGRFGAAFFANSARPDLVITTEAEMDENKQKQARATWEANFKGVLKAFRAAWLGGAKWNIQPITPNPVDLAMSDLTNQADVKILAVLRVNPVLAGIGTAADPLSAQGTYDSIRSQHLEFVAIPDVRQICNVLNEQWLHVDFPGQDWTLEPDIAAILSDAMGNNERITASSTAVVNHFWSVNDAREHTGKEPWDYAININPDWAFAGYEKGILTHRQTLLAIGYAPKTVTAQDVYIWDRDPRAKAPAQQPMQFNPFGGQPQFPQSAPAQISAPANSDQPPARNAEPVTVAAVPLRRNVDELAQLHELGLWSKKVKRSGKAARFNAEVLPADLMAWVRTALNEDWNPQAVFDGAKRWVRTGEPQSVGATPEEYTAYWSEFDSLQSDIREAWLTEYMAKVWASLQGQLSESLTDEQLRGILAQHHDELTAAWVGTPENPGALYALALAGLVAGDKTLKTGYAAKPQRAVPPTVGVSFDLLATQALEFVKRYSFDLIKGIDQTTVDLVRGAIDKGLAEGQTIDQIAAALGDVFADPARAKLIASTESLKAYNQGAFSRWTNAGVTQGKWRTVNDGNHVCPICRRLNEQVGALSVGWVDPETGNIYHDSAHPGCRCFRQPIL